ncbi:ClpP family protease [Dactylosporangium sp. NPDC048998]|uniref:ClpP family protease n=1 Tax=Dactylosporangium sp. NPDC048998 TaxID=3363976 RepID=UPI0037205608
MADLDIPFDSAVFDRLLSKRIIVLGTEVDDKSANRICGQLILLAAEDPDKDISFWINSPGGAVHAGLAIYDTMKFVRNDISTVVMGMAASMGQFLLSAGTPGKRYALPHSRVMMHQPSGGIGGTAADIAIQAEQMVYTKKTIQRLIAEHTGQTSAQIEEDSDRDRWFTAPEAVAYGFVDRVVAAADQLALS